MSIWAYSGSIQEHDRDSNRTARLSTAGLENIKTSWRNTISIRNEFLNLNTNIRNIINNNLVKLLLPVINSFYFFMLIMRITIGRQDFVYSLYTPIIPYVIDKSLYQGNIILFTF